MFIKKKFKYTNIFFDFVICTMYAQAAFSSDSLSRESIIISEKNSFSVHDLTFNETQIFLGNATEGRLYHLIDRYHHSIAKLNSKLKISKDIKSSHSRLKISSQSISLSYNCPNSLFDTNCNEELNFSNENQSIKKLYSILIVEDNSIIRKILERYFKKNFNLLHRLTFANNGEEAFKYLDQGKHFDWLVTDIQMPVLDGIGLINKIIAAKKFNIPITVYSAEEKKGKKGIRQKIPNSIKIIHKNKPKKLLEFLEEQLTQNI